MKFSLNSSKIASQVAYYKLLVPSCLYAAMVREFVPRRVVLLDAAQLSLLIWWRTSAINYSNYFYDQLMFGEVFKVVDFAKEGLVFNGGFPV